MKGSTNCIQTELSNLKNLVNQKQDILTFDSAPVSGSSNPVTSGGLFTEIDRKSWQRFDYEGVIDSVNRTVTYSFTQRCHGLVYFLYRHHYTDRTGWYHKLAITSWGMTMIADHGQNYFGSIAESGYMEAGNYTVTFTFDSTTSSSFPLSSTCSLYYIGDSTY